MSDHQESHLDQTAAALAALTVCIVQTLGESDSTFRSRFVTNLEALHYKARDNHLFQVPALEVLTLVRDLLKK